MIDYLTKEDLLKFLEPCLDDIPIMIERNGYIQGFDIHYVNNKSTNFEGRIVLKIETQ